MLQGCEVDIIPVVGAVKLNVLTMLKATASDNEARCREGSQAVQSAALCVRAGCIYAHAYARAG